MTPKLIAHSLIASAALVAAPCFAAENDTGEVGYIPKVSATPSSVTRAEVYEELMQAQRDGTMPQTGEGADIGAVVASQKPTDEMKPRTVALQPGVAAN